MRKWLEEDWRFTVEVLRVGPHNRPEGYCRMGFEVGDAFTCTYGCPDGFCPKTMSVLHALCEAVRAGGDLRLLGGQEALQKLFCCADGVVSFLLRAEHVEPEDAPQ